ncbi:hypothetical protein TIFTF001_003999 [Ficus carica]|uniref:Uncharacterized protein n=1 Tax=Ficus carica TaxID=3494 RepID=A0AA88A2R2_FICCA|nr:hypothetical protein TIFTF001_003999 [Ficus carica]
MGEFSHGTSKVGDGRQHKQGVVVGGRGATTIYEAWEVTMQIWHEGDDATAS